jgi:hypothetical protein
MSVIISTQAMNIVEAQKREGYTNSAEFLGALVKKIDLLNFAPFFPSSDGTFHKWVQASRLGAGAFTKANENVPSISSGADTKIEPIAMYQGDSTIDDVVIKTAKEPAKARDSEDVANLEGFTQDWLYKLMYGIDSADGIRGLAARRATSDSTYTWKDTGTGSDLTSIWLFEFGERGFNFRYPAGTQPGIISEDRGRHKVPTPSGVGTMWAWIRHFEIAAGMEIKTEKALLRLANIESGGDTFPSNTFIKMKNQLPSMGRDAVAFANRTVHALVETAAYNKINMSFSIADVEGFGPVARIVGIPVMFWETIVDTESAIS